MERNRFESAVVKLMLTGASIIMTCIIIAIGAINLKQGRQISNVTMSKISDFAGELSHSEITMYDGLSVMGSDVINFYKKYFYTIHEGDTNPFSLEVKTSLGRFVYEDGTFLKLIRDNSTSNYIKPTAKFIGEVVSNDNKVIVKVIFTEE